MSPKKSTIYNSVKNHFSGIKVNLWWQNFLRQKQKVQSAKKVWVGHDFLPSHTFLQLFWQQKVRHGKEVRPKLTWNCRFAEKSIVMGKLECSFFKIICWDVFWLLYIEHLYFQLIFSFNIACDEYIGYFLQLYMWVYKFLWKHSVDFVSMTGLPEFDLFTCIRSWEPLLTPNIPPPPPSIPPMRCSK